MHVPRSGVIHPLIAALAVSLALLSIGCVAAPPPQPSSSPGAEEFSARRDQQLRDWYMAWDSINSGFYDPGLKGVDWPRIRTEVSARIESGLEWPAFHELLRTTIALFKDSHTLYLPPEQARAFQTRLEGKDFGGIGIYMDKGRGDYISIVMTIRGGPADEAGLKPHDRILSIDGGTALDEYGNPDSSKLKGPVGSKVRLRIESPDGEREVELERKLMSPVLTIAQGTILPLEATGGKRIGYIVLANFLSGSARDLRAEYERLSVDAPLAGLVLDLRSNSGGLPEEVLSTLGLFLEGIVGADRDRNGGLTPIVAHGDGIRNSREIPLALLVNAPTESGAEILAAGLKARGRAVLVGERTAGGLGEGHYRTLSGGGTIMVSERFFVLADGRDPGWLDQGIEPDIVVPNSGWDDCFGVVDIAINTAVQALRIH